MGSYKLLVVKRRISVNSCIQFLMSGIFRVSKGHFSGLGPERGVPLLLSYGGDLPVGSSSSQAWRFKLPGFPCGLFFIFVVMLMRVQFLILHSR